MTRTASLRLLASVASAVLAAACASTGAKPGGTAPPMPTGAGAVMKPIPNPTAREPEPAPIHREPRPAPTPPTATPPAPAPAAPKPAPNPQAGAVDPARAAKLRAAGLEQLNRGAVAKAVALLSEAQRLDPTNALIQRDLARAQRIARAVGSRR